ncbi:heme lyase NrfEFG subunit NrfF [Aeromonas bestiarum]|uniref:heme lyase NrfEFG subunit NrfF n=1 Tax=Aeromonas bestiarum TaxID=105751 RepID=UPI002378843C|nr:heme lyase NrfEFG subunit NrfF [Aeromonas bestiarum]WDL84415.1 heme lyase NrfEFG subunit NrfF [Aeromonas bestiarum]
MKGFIILCALLVLGVPLSQGALASGVDTYQFQHPELQSRAQDLARALRCPQCQNQNLVESNSPIARDLRLEVYRWVDEGQSDEQVIARMTSRFGDFVRYAPPFKASTALLWGGPALLLLLALARLRASLQRKQPVQAPLLGYQPQGEPAQDPRAELNRRIMAEQQAGLAPHSRLYRELELARLANATPATEQALRARVASSHTASRPLPWLLLGALLLALIVGVYSSTNRYQAWQAYQDRPDPLAGLSPRDLQDKELGALHQRLQSNAQDLDGWAELGQLYLYRDEYEDAWLAYQRLALLEGGASAATLAAQATVRYYQAGQQFTPEARRLLDAALALDKGEVSALMLLAADHFLHGRYSQAIALWQRLLDEERPRINRAALIQAIQTARIMGG